MESAREGASVEDELEEEMKDLPTDARVDVLVAAMESSQASANETRLEVAALKEQVSALEARLVAVEALEARVDASEAGMDSLRARVGVLEAGLDALNASHAAMLLDDTVHRADALEARLDAVNATLEASKAYVSAQQRVQAAEDRISALETGLSSLGARVSTVNASVPAAAQAAREDAANATRLALVAADAARAATEEAEAAMRLAENASNTVPAASAAALAELEASVGVLQGSVGVINASVVARTTSLTRSAWMMQQQYEVNNRLSGASGVISVRGTQGGSRAYHDSTDASWASISAHDHADYLLTIGMGEISASLNGYGPLISRHNDYRLQQNDAVPGGRLRNLKDITPPPVPPSVLAKATVEEQSAEMREYFRAWRDSDRSHRDYEPYFKPNLCVLEFSWLKADEALTDPFRSDRHELAAKNWDDLRRKNAWLFDSGHKDTAENIGFFGSAVRGITHDGQPIVGNLDYRIFCHPLQDPLPLDQLRLSQHLSSRLSTASPLSSSKLYFDRRARFDVNGRRGTYPSWIDGPYNNGKMDDLMAQIPGRDGYTANMSNDVEVAWSRKVKYPTFDSRDRTKRLNAGFYHRYYYTSLDATGRSMRRKGFADPTLWAAQTTQPSVLPSVSPLGDDTVDDSLKEQRWTYAVPLEIVFMTPLLSWNPYDFKMYGTGATGAYCNDFVKADGRNGDPYDPAKAYNGTCGGAFFRTPLSFYNPAFNDTTDPADTGVRVTGVLDRQGTLRRVRESGTKMILPDIGGGVGKVRLRFPVYPTRSEGEDSWKEVKALQTVLLEASSDGSIGLEDVVANFRGLELELSAATTGASHTHGITLNSADVDDLEAGKSVTAVTSLADGHTHSVTLSRVQSGSKWRYILEACDSHSAPCGDGHASVVDPTE